MELPLAALERILKKAGAGRISTKATEEFARMLEDYAAGLAAEAAAFAEHANRNTVLEEDVMLAKKRNR